MDIEYVKNLPGYCTHGPHEGMYEIRIIGKLYLTPDEYAVYSEHGLVLVVSNAAGED
jgi:hypothetical protein